MNKNDLTLSALPKYLQNDQDQQDVKTPGTPGLDEAAAVQVPMLPNKIERTSRNPLTNATAYPKLDYSSRQAFGRSLAVRLRAIFTWRFILCLLWGQVLSVCITATNVTTTELSIGNWHAPTTQSFFVYLTLFSIYTPYTIYSYGFKSWLSMIRTDGWKYFILAAVDVEANYSVVLAYRYTDILSAALLDSFATPVCMIVTYFLVRARFHWTQILGVFICLGGLALLIVSDLKVNGSIYTTGQNKLKGDLLMILGASLYGISNGLEEFFVRNRPLYEVVGQLGMWGVLINGIQAGALEHNAIAHTAVWSGANVGYLVAFCSAMLLIYTTAPLLFRASSSPFYNLSLLTSDFWSLCFGIGIFHVRTYWLYWLAFPLVLTGCVIYFSCASPAHQADESMVVTPRGNCAEKEGINETA